LNLEKRCALIIPPSGCRGSRQHTSEITQENAAVKGTEADLQVTC
jgi:hypothetical protein